jgi:trypsin-like peptidase
MKNRSIRVIFLKDFLNHNSILSNVALISTIFLILVGSIMPVGAEEIEHISLITTPILSLKGNDLISQGTGFYYLLEDSIKGEILFLVTNYHVLTGHPPNENTPPEVDNIICYLHKNPKDPGEVKEIKIHLYTKNNDEVWITSDKYPEADVAAIPILAKYQEETIVYAINEDWTKSNMRIRPTSPVVLIGYPLCFFDTKNWLPIWKTGALASEPDYNFNDDPLMIIDISAYPGMSGSPAFAVANGAYHTVDGPTTVGSVRMFLGIFAGMRVQSEEKYIEELVQTETKKGIKTSTSLELGYIWKADIIIDMIKKIDIEKYKEKILKNL